ncbi:MAG: RDD family protein [Maricaulaceae bacterium]
MADAASNPQGGSQATAPSRAQAQAQARVRRMMSDDPMQRRFVTPEGVDLRLRVATASDRMGAFLIDMAIIVGSLILISFFSAFAFAASGLEGGGAIAIIWLLAFFFLRNFYFAAFEIGPQAATPGKRALGLRVASRNGERLTAQAVLARNATREIEVFLPITFLFSGATDIDAVIVLAGFVWSAIFLLFPLFNRDRLRAGDLIAGTWVIKNPKRRLDADLASQKARPSGEFAFTQEQLDAYGIHELQVLEDVLRRSEPETITAVADRIRTKIGWSKQTGETDPAFLAAYYPALRQRLEAKLLLGVRRRDKYDKR